MSGENRFDADELDRHRDRWVQDQAIYLREDELEEEEPYLTTFALDHTNNVSDIETDPGSALLACLNPGVNLQERLRQLADIMLACLQARDVALSKDLLVAIPINVSSAMRRDRNKPQAAVRRQVLPFYRHAVLRVHGIQYAVQSAIPGSDARFNLPDGTTVSQIFDNHLAGMEFASAISSLELVWSFDTQETKPNVPSDCRDRLLDCADAFTSKFANGTMVAHMGTHTTKYWRDAEEISQELDPAAVHFRPSPSVKHDEEQTEGWTCLTMEQFGKCWIQNTAYRLLDESRRDTGPERLAEWLQYGEDIPDDWYRPTAQYDWWSCMCCWDVFYDCVYDLPDHIMERLKRAYPDLA